MAQEYSTKLTLKDNFSAVIQKAISATESLRSKLQATEKDLGKLGNKKVKIGAELDSSVNSSLNKLADKIPKDKTIKIKAKDEVTRNVTNMQRDIYKMGREISLGMKDPFRGLNRSTISATGNLVTMRNAARELARSMATSQVAAQMAGNAMVASAAAGAALGRTMKGKGGTRMILSPHGWIADPRKGKNEGLGTTKHGYGSFRTVPTNSGGIHVAGSYAAGGAALGTQRLDGRTHKDFMGRGGTFKGVKAVAGDDYFNMIRSQRQYMMQNFGSLGSLQKFIPKSNVKLANVLTPDGKKIRAGMNVVFEQMNAVERYGRRISSSLKSVYSSAADGAKSGFRVVKSGMDSMWNSPFMKSGRQIAMGGVFAAQRGLFSAKGMTTVIGAKFKDLGARSGINSLIAMIKNKTFSVNVKANVASAKSAINSLKNSTATISMVGGAAAAAGGLTAVKGAAQLESNSIAIEHFVKYANVRKASKGEEALKSDGQIKSESDAYMGKLRKYAVDTPFGDVEVMDAGRRAVNVMNGDLKDAEELVKIAGDMAALNPGKTIMQAMEALADLKTGEMERMKEFGLKISAEQFKGLVGKGKNDDLTEDEQTQAYRTLMDHKLKTQFGGGAKKLSNSAAGKWSTVTGSAEAGLADIGTMFLPGVKDALDSMSEMINTYGPIISAALKPVADAFNALMKTELGSKIVVITVAVAAGALAFGAFCAAVSLLATPLGMVVKGFGMLMSGLRMASTVITVVRTAMLGLNLAFLANPITWVVAGVIALVAAGIWLYKNWDKVKQFFADMWVGPSAAIDRFKEGAKKWLGEAGDWLQSKWEGVKQFFADLWVGPSAAIDRFVEGIRSGFNAVVEWVKEKWQSLCDFFSLNILRPKVMFGSDSGPDGPMPIPTGEGGVTPPDGSGWDGSDRAVGMEYIPYNGFQINAHRGEAILTRTEADAWRSGRSSYSGGVTINIHDPVVREESDLDRLGTLLAQKISEVRSNMGAVPVSA